MSTFVDKCAVSDDLRSSLVRIVDEFKKNPSAVSDIELTEVLHLALKKDSQKVFAYVKETEAALRQRQVVVAEIKSDFFSRRIRVEKMLQEKEAELYWTMRNTSVSQNNDAEQQISDD
jgi:hypothetical protein